MAKISPFKAVRPVAEKAAAVASRPYDVLNSKEAREEVKDNPLSFLHITKAEVDLPESIDIHHQAVYDKAKENFQQFLTDGTLIQEEVAAYYIYELVMDGRSQTGLVCTSAVSDYFDDTIKKHEYTRPEKEQDRISHMHTIQAQTGNVFLAYNHVNEISSLINNWKEEKTALYSFTAEDGIKHTVWAVNEPDTVNAITFLFAEKVPHTYIADGHHRAASAAKVSKLINSKEAQYFLTTIFPDNELAILDYNRVVKDLNGLTKEDLLEKAAQYFLIEKSTTAVKPTQLHQFGLYIDKEWYTLVAKPATYSNDPIGVLDVTILTNTLLKEVLNIQDQRTDTRIDFVGGIRGIGELEKRVNSGEMALAVSLYPVTIQQLFAIADSGNVMPPKSTWFEPKLRDGLLTHTL